MAPQLYLGPYAEANKRTKEAHRRALGFPEVSPTALAAERYAEILGEGEMARGRRREQREQDNWEKTFTESQRQFNVSQESQQKQSEATNAINQGYLSMGQQKAKNEAGAAKVTGLYQMGTMAGELFKNPVVNKLFGMTKKDGGQDGVVRKETPMPEASFSGFDADTSLSAPSFSGFNLGKSFVTPYGGGAPTRDTGSSLPGKAAWALGTPSTSYSFTESSLPFTSQQQSFTDFDLDVTPSFKDFELGSATGDGTVICTELNRQGILDDQTYLGDSAFGKTLPLDVLRGYHLWAEPIARKMRDSRLLTKIVWMFAKPWSKEMAYVTGMSDKGSIVGRCFMKIGIPLCGCIGRHFKKRFLLQNLFGFGNVEA